MPAIENHPLRLLRIRAGLTQIELARRAGLTRNAIQQVEEGRVRRPSSAIFRALAAASGTPEAAIRDKMKLWLESPPDLDRLSQRAKNTLMLPPTILHRYRDFSQWRGDIANPTAFASIVKVPRATLMKYETGKTASMPKVLYRALHDQLGLSEEYVEELRKLDVQGQN